MNFKKAHCLRQTQQHLVNSLLSFRSLIYLIHMFCYIQTYQNSRILELTLKYLFMCKLRKYRDAILGNCGSLRDETARRERIKKIPTEYLGEVIVILAFISSRINRYVVLDEESRLSPTFSFPFFFIKYKLKMDLYTTH